MLNFELENIISRASMAEVTPALRDFWLKQYKELFEVKAGYTSAEQRGFVNLLAHLDETKKDLDHSLVQQTVTGLVRFLDAVCEDEEYRSIRLSVNQFAEFLKETETSVQIGIDYVGGLVADFGYRASESLAQEKGSFPKLDAASLHIRQIEHETWVNQQGDYKSGQEITTLYNDKTIQSSGWKLMSRRNFAILDFPKEPIYWDKWRDAYHSHDILDTQSGSEVPDLEFFDTSGVEDDALMTAQADVSDAREVRFDSSSDTGLDQSMPSHQEQVSSETSQEESLIEESLAVTHRESAESITYLEDQPEDVLFSQAAEPKDNLDTSEKLVLGELVKVADESSKWHDQVFQVVEMGQSDHLVRLGGGSDLQDQNWEIGQLEKVDLYDILARINKQPEPKKPFAVETNHVVAGSAALIFNNHGEILLSLEDAEIAYGAQPFWTLPKTIIKPNQIPEEAILKLVKSFVNGGVRILDEVGSVMAATRHKSEDPSLSTNLSTNIYNVFLLDLGPDFASELSKEGLKYFKLSELPLLAGLAKVALEKHTRKQKNLSEVVSLKLQALKEEYQAEIEAELRQEYEQKLLKHLPNLDQVQTSTVSKTVEMPHGQQEQISKKEPTVSSTKLGKYKINLNAWLDSPEFGALKFCVGYNAQGIESLKLDQVDLSPEVRSVVNLVLNLFNHILAQHHDLQTLLKGFDWQSGQETEIPAVGVLRLVIDEIEHLPKRFEGVADSAH